MGEFERKQRPLVPDWRSSQGRLRPARALPQKAGQDHQTGYESHPGERERPRESGRLESSFVRVSVGSSRKKEVTVVLSQRRRQTGPAVMDEEKNLKSRSARVLRSARGRLLTNADGKENSAVAYRASNKTTPGHLLERFREMLDKHGQVALKEQVPFLDRTPEQRELRALEQEARALRERRAARALGRVEDRKQELRQVLTEKQIRKQQMHQLLRKAQAEARQRTERVWAMEHQTAAAEVKEEPEDGEAPQPPADPNKLT